MMHRPDIDLSEVTWRFPTPDIVELSNGLRVHRFVMPGQKVASIELSMPISLADEPAHLEGVGTVALHALDEATISHPNMPELVDTCGASMHARARVLATRIGGLVPTRRLDDLLPLLTEMLTEPAYNEADIANHVEALEASYRTSLTSSSAAAARAFRMALYGPDSRQGRPISGSPATLEAITPDDVHTWQRRHYAPNGATVVIAGEDPFVDLTALEAWSGTAERSPAPAPFSLPGNVVIVDVPGSVQATMHVGLRSLSREDERWASARIAGHIIAGAFASRLNLELRERLGYTYGVHGGFVPTSSASIMQISTSTRTEVAGDALSRIISTLQLPEDFTDKELVDAKAFQIGIAPLAYETSADITVQAIALTEAGIGAEFINSHAEELAKVSSTGASEVWRELVDTDALCIAVAGDAAALQRELADFEPKVIELAR